MAHETAYSCTTNSADETKNLGEMLAECVRPGDVIVFEGDLGAGKTQFVQGVARGLGVLSDVTSPTFNIVVEYHDGRLPLYHFDLYRLDDPEELEDIGFYEIVEGDGVSFLEWGFRFPEELPYDYLRIDVTADTSGVRTIAAEACGARSGELLRDWTSRL